jgi:hypothetical protein
VVHSTRRLSSLALLGVLAGCGSPGSQDQGLGDLFPDQFRELNDASRGFRAREGDSWVLVPSRSRWQPDTLEVVLPAQATRPMRMSVKDLAIDVREEGIDGPAQVVGNLITYRRGKGKSYWMGGERGVEEWLLLPDGVADARVAVASWRVEGAELDQAGPYVLVKDHTGRARIQVSAERAFGPSGEPLMLELRSDGDRIDLFVQVSAGPVLVDPLWIDLAVMNQGRSNHAATLLLNGTVLVSGGISSFAQPSGGGSGGSGVLDAAEIYDPPTAIWNPIGDMFNQRINHTLTTLNDGRALAHGGEDDFGFTVYCPELWNPAIPAWTTPSSGGCSICGPAGGHTATKLADGSVLLVGGTGSGSVGEVVFGISGGFGATDCAERFIPGGDSYNFADDLLDARRDHAAVRLADDRVLVSGGVDSGGFGLDSTEIYDPTFDNWDGFSSMNTDRANHTLTRLCDDRVLAAGGETNSAGAVDSAEIYDVVADSWTPTPSMQQRRVGHTANLLANCRVLVVGGYDGTGNALDNAELYDPVSNTWIITESITGVRGDATGTSLLNQSVLVAGGFDGDFTSLDTSMVYQGLLPDGDSCITGADCLSGECADDVCCDTPCAGACEACRGQGNDGVCEPIAAGTDPDAECANDGQASCGQNGSCDGNGACGLWTSGTICDPIGCQGADVLNADTCNGGGTCVDNGTTDCALYSCAAGACLTSCADHPDCDGDVAYCDTTNQCVPKKDNGEPATSPDECLSGFLADDVCCNEACDGQNGTVCDACTVAEGGAVDGTCSLLNDCDDGDDCTLDACNNQTLECGYESKLNGSPCTDGTCQAGNCVPDAEVTSSGNGGSSSGPGSGGSSSTSTGSAGDNLGDPRIEGGGICDASIAGKRSGDPPAWLLLGLVPWLRWRSGRRRRS